MLYGDGVKMSPSTNGSYDMTSIFDKNKCEQIASFVPHSQNVKVLGTEPHRNELLWNDCFKIIDFICPFYVYLIVLKEKQPEHMIYNGKEVEFPAVMQISFFKVIDSLEEMAKDKDKDTATYAKQMLKEVEKHPELRDGITDITELDKLKGPISKIARLMFPDALTTNEIKALSPPFYFKPILTSTRFDNIVKASGQDYNLDMKDVDEDTFYLYCCFFILGSYFGFPVNSTGSWTQEIMN